MSQAVRELDSTSSNLQENYFIPQDDKMQAMRLRQVVKKNGVIHFDNLPIIEGEEVEMLLLFGTKPQSNGKKQLTARQLLNSDLIGMWKDRTDIVDSSTYARQLREKIQRRNHDSFG